MKRALVILLGALLLALAISAGTVVFLAATEGGTRLLAGQAERFLPLELNDVSGALLGEIEVGEAVYRLDGRTLRIEDLAVAVRTMPLLFDNLLVVERASAALVALSGPGSDEPGPPPVLQLPYMPVDIDVGRLRIERLAIDGVFPMAVSASAAWHADGLQVRSLTVRSEVLHGDLQGSLGNGSNPLLQARVRWSLPDSEWDGEGRIDGRVDAFELAHTLRGLVSGEQVGTGSLAVLTEPSVDVNVALEDLELGDTAVRGIGGRIHGTLANLTADAAGRVHAPRLEPFDLSVTAYGPVNGPLTLSDVRADAAGGSQQAQGSVAWEEEVQVSLGGLLNGIVLSALSPDIAGNLDAAFQFLYRDDRLAFTLRDVSGTFEGRPLDGEVHVAQVEGGWEAAPLELQIGDNHLSGRGRLAGSTLALDAELMARNLAALDLGITGDAEGFVRVSGTWPDLDGTASLSSTDLEGFGAVLAGARLDASMTGGVLDARAAAARAGTEALLLADVDLAANGRLEDLEWRLDWAAGAAAGTLRQGDEALTAQVRSFGFQALERTWSLRDTAVVTIAPERVDVASACLTGGEAAACIEQLSYADGRVGTVGTLKRAPVGLLQPWLPVRLGEAGYLEGSWALEGDPDDVRGDLTLAARQLTYLPATEDAPVELPDLEATGRIEDDTLNVRLAATDEAFRVTGVARLQPLDLQGALRGDLQVAIDDLSPVRVLDQRIETFEGRIDGSLELSGTPAAPRVDGRFVLADGALHLNDPDIDLSDLTLRLRLDESGTFELEGSARQEDAPIRVAASGSGAFSDALRIDASLEGEQLEARHPDWEITVSPDLAFTYAGGVGRVRGRVTVPEAEVRLTTLPSSVPSPSEDVVVVGREPGGGDADNWLRLDVEVVVGEDVTLEALGINAELEGTLRARLDDQGRTSLRGTLDVTGGEITAQGQTLAIQSGTVVYNGPVTRPYIDVRAVRVIEDVTPEVTVGLHIRGDADNLTSSVFSEPAMSETRALGFLVLGRDIEEGSEEDDGNQLMAAAINLGLSRSKGITSEIMRRTGLDELSASAEASDSFDIIAGKRVTRDLYVRYTYNTLSALGAFLIRYELSDRWQLEAESGEQSAMDLLYSVEK